MTKKTVVTAWLYFKHCQGEAEITHESPGLGEQAFLFRPVRVNAPLFCNAVGTAGNAWQLLLRTCSIPELAQFHNDRT